MQTEIIHDPLFLACKSEQATIDDLPVAQKLLRTLIEHCFECVGMAANMIGVNKGSLLSAKKPDLRSC